MNMPSQSQCQKELEFFSAKENQFLNNIYPLQLQQIIVNDDVSEDVDFVKILHSPAAGEYYRLTEAGHFIWNLLDGQRSCKDIVLAVCQKFDLFVPNEICHLLVDLTEKGFIENADELKNFDKKDVPKWVVVLDKAKNIFEANITFGEADEWIDRSFKRWIHWLFSRPALYLMLIIVVFGMVAFGYLSFSIGKWLEVSKYIWPVFISVYVIDLLLFSLHELAHAYTTKFFGRHVKSFGIGWYWTSPVAFTDTTDMCLSPKKQRMTVDAAGMFFDAVLAGISIIVGQLSGNVDIMLASWLYAAFIYLSIINNFYPLFELDGYYLLMDYFERPLLREDALSWIISLFSKSSSEKKWSRQYFPEITYWLSCIILLGLVSVSAIVFQAVFLSHLFPVLKEPLYQWIFPVVAISTYFLSTWASIKKKMIQA